METKKRVLLVDDDLEFANKLSEKLRAVDLEPVVMASGKEAIDYIAQNHIDFIILDFVMPEMDGYAFFHIMEHDMRKNIPTVILTNFPKSKGNVGDLDVFVKNETDLDEFVSMIQEKLSTSV